MAADPKHWWKGAHGEWLVVAQVALMALVFFGPRTLSDLPAWPFSFAVLWRIAGGLLMVVGGILFAAGVFRLGPGLTPLPYPRDGAHLVETGAFALVRHPMYAGGLILALGWALFVRGLLTMGYVIILFLFLDRKAAREECWLAEKHPTYGDYRKRVRKLIPFIY
jgi:protein-S-isoprenylcysteine O-methyltransferase Ste14